jgi:hypothetical protein
MRIPLAVMSVDATDFIVAVSFIDSAGIDKCYYMIAITHLRSAYRGSYYRCAGIINYFTTK